jgi:CheY-like chemotaxis protein
MNQEQTILLVDDSENDLLLMRHAFRAAEFDASLQFVHSGEDAILYLKGEGTYADRDKFPLPAVMLLDLNIPKMSGFDVLAWVRAQPVIKRLPVIVLTASIRREDVERAFDLGANAFLVKPGKMNELVTMTLRLRDWLEYNHFPLLDVALSG